MSRRVQLLTSMLLASAPLSAAGQSKPKASAKRPAVMVVPAAPVSTFRYGTRLGLPLAAHAAPKFSPSEPDKATIVIRETRADLDLADDLTLWEIVREGVVWDVVTHGKFTPQNVRRAMLGKPLAATASGQSLTLQVTHGQPTDLFVREQAYALTAPLAVHQPIGVRRKAAGADQGASHIVVARPKRRHQLRFLGDDEFFDPAVTAKQAWHSPYANEVVIGATPAHKTFDPKLGGYGPTTIVVRGGINALTPGATYTVTQRRTGVVIARGAAHEQTGSFRAKLAVRDYRADDLFDLVIATGEPAQQDGYATAQYEFAAPAAAPAMATTTAAPALRPLSLKANGKRVYRKAYSQEEESLFQSIEAVLYPSPWASDIATQIRDQLPAYKDGKATATERRFLLRMVKSYVLDTVREGTHTVEGVTFDQGGIKLKLWGRSSRSYTTAEFPLPR